MHGKVRELRSLIYGAYDSEAEFAKAVGWQKQKVNKITNGKKEPNLTEINAMANALKVPMDDIAQIFLRYLSPNEPQAKHTS